MFILWVFSDVSLSDGRESKEGGGGEELNYLMSINFNSYFIYYFSHILLFVNFLYFYSYSQINFITRIMRKV